MNYVSNFSLRVFIFRKYISFSATVWIFESVTYFTKISRPICRNRSKCSLPRRIVFVNYSSTPAFLFARDRRRNEFRRFCFVSLGWVTREREYDEYRTSLVISLHASKISSGFIYKKCAPKSTRDLLANVQADEKYNKKKNNEIGSKRYIMTNVLSG